MLTIARTTPSAPLEPGVRCTVFAAHLPLRTRRDLPAAARWSRAARALADSPGAAGCRVAVELVRPAIWIVSLWTSRTALLDFERSDAHQRAKAALRRALLPPTFAVWSCRFGEAGAEWPEVQRRIGQAARHQRY